MSIFQIAAFDFYDLNDHLHDWLNIEPTEPFNDNFNELGFESRYMLNNMGTMILFVLAYPFLLIVQKALFQCKNCCQSIKRPHSKLKRSLYFALPITVMLESYSILALCCMIAIPVVSFASVGLTIQSLVCIFFGVCILTVPFIVIRKVVRKFHYLGDDRVSKRYGKLYE